MHTWERLKSFLIRAGRVILIIVVILSFLNSIGTDGSFGNEDSDSSVLSKIGMTITPIFTPMGISDENWPATVGLFTGIFAKEAVVGTLDSLYAGLDAKEGANPEDKEFELSEAVKNAFASIPIGVLSVADTITDPLGIGVGEIKDIATAAEEQEVSKSTFGAMIKRFDGTAGAFAYLLFILLYAPCVAALAAIWREISPGWAVFSSVYLSVLAWSVSVLYYQSATFTQHPQSSITWIITITLLLSAGIIGLARFNNKQSTRSLKLI